jgi:hypothetical protein
MMQRRRRYPSRIDYPMVMIAQAHMRQLEREIEEARLAKLARDTRQYRGRCLPALVAWLREKLPPRLSTDAQPVRAGGLSSTGVEQQ